MTDASKNKLIIKNTLLLYGRMFLAMVVSFYTSRVVFQVLGVENYGIYGVVGGIIPIIGFINGSLSASTSRFITFELGRDEKNNNNSQLKTTFNTAFIIHLTLAVIVFILAETLGLWFLENKLVIPEGRMYAARWVYQLSVLSMVIGFTQVPYSACIISHERIDIYTYVELATMFLRLGAVYLLVIGNFDKLILHSVLMTSISIGNLLYCRFFCIHHFKECHLSLKFDKSIMRRMMVFSGWNVYYNASITARETCIGMLINMFFGVAINAASSISGQVNGAVRGFSFNILTAVRPQITKSFSQQDYNRTSELIHYSTVIILYLMAIIIIPLMAETHYLLLLWLGSVPDWTVCFCRFSFMFNLIIALSYLSLTITDAAEKNKYPSIVNGTVYILALPISYFVFKYFHLVWFAAFYNCFAVLFGLTFFSWLASRCLPTLSFRKYFLGVILKNVLLLSIITGITFSITLIMPECLLRMVVIFFISCILVIIAGYYFGMDKAMRLSTNNTVKKFTQKIKIRK